MKSVWNSNTKLNEIVSILVLNHPAISALEAEDLNPIQAEYTSIVINAYWETINSLLDHGFNDKLFSDDETQQFYDYFFGQLFGSGNEVNLIGNGEMNMEPADIPNEQQRMDSWQYLVQLTAKYYS